jgi:hypothetical protein
MIIARFCILVEQFLNLFRCCSIGALEKVAVYVCRRAGARVACSACDWLVMGSIPVGGCPKTGCVRLKFPTLPHTKATKNQDQSFDLTLVFVMVTYSVHNLLTL